MPQDKWTEVWLSEIRGTGNESCKGHTEDFSELREGTRREDDWILVINLPDYLS